MPVTRITSRQNPLIRQIASLHEKKYRDQSRLFLLEGVKLFEEALASDVPISYIFTTPDTLPRCLSMMGLKDESEAPEHLICLPESVFEKISTEKSPQGLLSVANYLDKRHFSGTIYNKDVSGRAFLLSSIRDPGNLGTIIRSARAFGVEHLILSPDCADLYNPKTVRAAMGTLFRQRITVVPDLSDAIGTLRRSGYEVYAAMLDERARSLASLTIGEKTAFVVGNEGHGIDAATASACTGSVIIPMAKDSAESLNAAIASSILLWHSHFASL
jgi:TrmH family RNA methyltransferase